MPSGLRLRLPFRLTLAILRSMGLRFPAPMLPGLALLFLGLGALMFAWRREGR